MVIMRILAEGLMPRGLTTSHATDGRETGQITAEVTKKRAAGRPLQANWKAIFTTT